MRDDRLEIRIPSDLKREVGEEAKRQDRSKAWIVIAAIKEYLAGREKNGG